MNFKKRWVGGGNDAISTYLFVREIERLDPEIEYSFAAITRKETIGTL